MPKNIKVTKQSESGLNTEFKVGSKTLSRGQLVKEIQAGKHPDYHVRKYGNKNIPCSNPDNNTKNNLG
ncbi:MAG: hypothetical protein JXK07_11585 [Spirochaetes bacterium]|nr:hypothetical protein [Spirochaetota bacterium]MBN2770824.1 hypothetical protein [Spirochaetota bacterium]